MHISLCAKQLKPAIMLRETMITGNLSLYFSSLPSGVGIGVCSGNAMGLLRQGASVGRSMHIPCA